MGSKGNWFSWENRVKKLPKVEPLGDPFVNKVVAKYKGRSEVGIKKYNTTLERKDLSVLDWLTHLQEEMMDATLYIEVLMKKQKENESK